MKATQSPVVSIWARLSLKALCVSIFVFLLLFASAASGAPIMTVQHTSGVASNATSLAVPFNSNVTSGNLILVAESSYEGVTLVTPTDSQSNSFTQLALTTVGTSGNDVEAIYAVTASTSGADTVTCNLSASNNIHCHIYELEGVTAVVDQMGQIQQASDSLSVSTSAATTNAVDYVIAFFSDNFSAELDMPGMGWADTELTDDPGGDTGFTEDMVVTATGVQTATATTFIGDYSTPDTYVDLIVALKTSGTATVATPTLSPATGTYGSAVAVTLSDTTLGSTIYYTTNGSAPSTSSSVYSNPITVSAAETLEALAAASGFAQSPVATAAYTMGVAGTGVPILTVQHNNGSNESASSIAVQFNSGVTAGNVLLVAESTYDGETLETPTDSLGNSFAQLVIAGVNSSDTAVVAVYGATANASGGDTVTCHISAVNNIHCHIYEVQGITATVDRTGNDQLFVYAQAVSTSDATANPVDYLFGFFADNYQASTYTAGTGFGDTELSNSDGGDSAFTEDAVAIATGIQTATGSNASGGNVYSPDGYYNIILALKATGTPTVPLPTFSPAAGTYLTAQAVTLSDSIPGATIYYTTNGTTPTTGSAVYSSPISVPAGETVEAFATASGTGFAPSPVATAVYLINPAATPTFSPAAGTYATAQTVTISDSTGGATIYYTTNGTTPTTSSATYSSPITVSATETLEAIATAAGQSNSAVGSVVYTIGTLAATPVFSPAGGVYTSAQSVSISDATGGATIYYTTNGSTPTTSSPVYTSAITVAASDKLEAIATASDYLQSTVGSAFYTISSSSTPIMTVQHTSGSNEDASSLAVPFNNSVTSGNVLIVAESTYAGVTLETPTDSLGNTYTQLVTGINSGGSVAAVYATTTTSSGADTVTCNTNNATNNIHCNIYEVQGITTTVDQTGTFSETGTSLTVSTSAATTNADDYVFAFFADNDNGSYLTPGPGMGDGELSNDGGDTGFSEDKVVVNTGIQTATATSNLNDAFENVLVALLTTGTPTAATPTLSPGTGTYTSVQYVTISSWTAGSTVHYTTDGTYPTTGSTLYTGQVAVSATETLEAIATAPGFANSPMNSAVYTINLPAATPTFSPAGGAYSSPQTVTISDTTPSATIYYTTDGSMPSSSSTLYGGPVTVSVWETLEAVAIAPGKSVSNVGAASYTIGNGETAAPTFSPGAGTYSSSQSVSISDQTPGATIYYTTDGTTPTAGSATYSSAITVSASETLKAIATAGGFTQSGVASAVYTINTTAGSCAGMSLGRSVDGTANMNGFVPFQNATNIAGLWSTNIANAAIDPNNAAIQTTPGYVSENARVLFGSSPGDGGIPFMIVDSGQTPPVPINVVGYANNSDVVVAPFPNNVPIEAAAADCSGWPDTYQSDAHTNVLDRNTCWDYETYNTNRCNGLYDADEEVIWDMLNGEMRPWGWTSTDAAGLSVMAGLVKYDEAASGNIQHAIRFTMQQSKNDANDGYFVEPASHAAGTSYGAPVVEGMRIRLKASYNTSGYSAINKAILVAMQQYGLIMADNGGYGYFIGATDSRWDDSDLANLGHIPMSNFDVLLMTPTYPGWDSVTAPTGAQPVINSFTASPQTVSAGTPVTFNFSVSGDSYDYIDMSGPVRLTPNGGGPGVNTGSATIYPTATQTYTLYAVNQYGNNGVGAGFGVTPSTPITIVVPGSVVVPPTFTPPAGPYTTAQVVTFNTTTYPFASFYYTTDGSTPTYPPTGTTIEYPQIPQPQSAQDVGNVEDITVAASETVNAIAVVQGYASPSAVTTGVYQIGPITGTPTFSPGAGSYGLAQTVTISDSTSGATIYYTTNGTTPTTGSSVYSSPITVSANETLEAFATSASANNSVVATAVYTIGGTAATPNFSPVAGNYVGNQSITISDTSSGASIYYTTNGSTPTTNSPVYSAPITVSTSETLEAFAAGSGYTNSTVASAAYTISASMPTFSPVAGSYMNPQTVTISDSTSGITVYYTTNGSTPTTNSPVYSAPITVSASETLEAIAAGGGNATSAVGSAAYTIVAATPTFSPAAGNYGVALTVTISDTTPNSTIYYTTNGSTPTTNSPTYSAPISVSSTETLEALATAAGDSNSAVGSVAYTLTIGGQAATPTLSLATGSYVGTQTVTISDASIGATIYYTLTPGTAGTPPTTSSTVYTGPVTVPSTSVLEAFAVGGGFTSSAVNSATYNITITVAFVQQCNSYGGYVTSTSCTLNGVGAGDALVIGVYTTGTDVPAITSSVGTPTAIISNLADYQGDMDAAILPNAASGSITITATTSDPTDTWISVTEYTNVSTSPVDTSASASLIGSYGSSSISTGNFSTASSYEMLWTMCYGIPSYAGWYAGTVPITWTAVNSYSGEGVIVEDGVVGAAGTYYGECDTTTTNGGALDASIMTVALKGAGPVAATPTFSPAAGTYTSIQTVTISDTTGSSIIYYTTNGTAPTTASSVYATPITVSATETLEAFATASGVGNSAVASAAYTINLLTTAATPLFSPAAGTYGAAQSVVIGTTTPSATIYFTTNGTAPTTSSSIYSTAITVSSTETLEAIAVATGYSNSAVASAAYTISAGGGSAPTYLQQCNNYLHSSGGTANSCTLNGVAPGDTIVIGIWTNAATLASVTASTGAPVVEISDYASPNEYWSNGYLSAYLLPNSAAGSITLTVNTPSAYTDSFISAVEFGNVPASPYDGQGTGTLHNYGADNDATTSTFSTSSASDMLWTMCEALPGITLSVDNAPITWTSVSNIAGNDAIILTEYGVAGAAGSYYGDCYKTAAGYGPDIEALALKGASTPTVATPTFSPGTETYTSVQTVTISDTTSGATIYYTTNGTAPTTASSVYSTPITVSTSLTLEAFATAAGDNNSSVAIATYIINLVQAATPGFSPAAGTYTSTQTVTISDSTTGATIYYTTNGAAPTTGSSVYSSAITVSATETLEAIATHSGDTNSAVGSAAYTINTSSGSPIYVQECDNSSTYTWGYSASCTLTGVGAGHGLLIGIYTESGETPTVTSSSGTPVSVISGLADYQGAMDAFILANTAAGSITITATTIGGTSTWVSVTEYSGVAASPLDNSASVSQVGGWAAPSVSTGNFTTTAAGDMLWSMCYGIPSYASWYAGTVPITWTAVDSYSSAGLFVEDGLAGAAGTYYGQCATTTANGGAALASIMTVALKPGSGAPPPPALTIPAPDTSTPLTGTSVAFAWTPGSATHFEFWVGTGVAGTNNLYNSGSVTATTETVSDLPSNGETIYARLYYLINGAWHYSDYTYVASGAPTQAVLTTPTPDTSTPLAGTSVAFAWSPGNLATHFEFWVGTTGAGSSNLYNSGNVTATTETVSGLPSNGETVNVRLYSLINGVWEYTDYTYKASGLPIPAVLTTPPPDTSTPLTGTSVTFSWTPGNLATQFEFRVGTAGPGSSNLYNSGNVTATSETVSNLPSNDSKVYVRLYSLINGALEYTDYTYISTGTATQAVLTTPTPNTSTPLMGTSVTFSWLPGNSATHFEFWVGTSIGSDNLYNSGNVTATSEMVSDLPSNGETVYVRLYSLINGAWQNTDYTYVANGSPTQAALITPTPDTSTPLTGTSVTFSWTPGNLATHFEFWVGTTGAGSSNLYNSGNVTATTEIVSDLPNNGQTVYVRLYTLLNGAWHSTDYTYVASGAPVAASLTTPTPNTSTPLTGTSVTFSWTPGNLATHFELYAGTTGAGSSNLYNSGNVTATSETVSNLPSNGGPVYVRLYSLINGAWQYTNYTYVASGAPTQAVLTAPTPNTSTPLTGTSVAFSWTPGNTATHFEFWVGTSVGSSNL